MWQTILAWLWELIKAYLKIPTVTSIFKGIWDTIAGWFSKIRQDQIDKDREGMKEALDDLRRAETPEEIDAAVEKIGKHI